MSLVEADCVIEEKHIIDGLAVRYCRAAPVGVHVCFRQHTCFGLFSSCTLAATSNHLAIYLSKTFSSSMNAIEVSTIGKPGSARPNQTALPQWTLGLMNVVLKWCICISSVQFNLIYFQVRSSWGPDPSDDCPLPASQCGKLYPDPFSSPLVLGWKGKDHLP